MELPSDPVILLSLINTKLRDFYPTLDILCDELDIDESEFEAIAKRTQAGVEWQFRAPDITGDSFIQCMRQQNQAGRAFLAAMQRGG